MNQSQNKNNKKEGTIGVLAFILLNYFDQISDYTLLGYLIKLFIIDNPNVSHVEIGNISLLVILVLFERYQCIDFVQKMFRKIDKIKKKKDPAYAEIPNIKKKILTLVMALTFTEPLLYVYLHFLGAKV